MPIILFSSNIRPQYERDIVNVAALASHQRYRFRYEQKYVDTALHSDLADDKLEGQKALIVYSIQQPAGYHPPAYVPIRWAEIARSWRRGEVFIVEFRVGHFPSIGEGRTPEECRNSILNVQQQLTTAVSGHPGDESPKKRYSCSASKDFAFGECGDDGIGFQQLARHLANTVAFVQQPFWTVSRLGRPGSLQSVLVDRSGTFRLESGRVFEIALSHYHPRDLPVIHRYRVTSDDRAVSLVGPAEFEIASRYDEIPIRFATQGDVTDVTESVLAIGPVDGRTAGPRVDIPLLIGRPDVIHVVET